MASWMFFALSLDSGPLLFSIATIKGPLVEFNSRKAISLGTEKLPSEGGDG